MTTTKEWVDEWIEDIKDEALIDIPDTKEEIELVRKFHQWLKDRKEEGKRRVLEQLREDQRIEQCLMKIKPEIKSDLKGEMLTFANLQERLHALQDKVMDFNCFRHKNVTFLQMQSTLFTYVGSNEKGRIYTSDLSEEKCFLHEVASSFACAVQYPSGFFQGVQLKNVQNLDSLTIIDMDNARCILPETCLCPPAREQKALTRLWKKVKPLGNFFRKPALSSTFLFLFKRSVDRLPKSKTTIGRFEILLLPQMAGEKVKLTYDVLPMFDISDAYSS